MPDIRGETPRLFSLTLFICIAVLVSFNTAYSSETTDEKADANVLARVGDESITKNDLETAMKNVPQNKREKYRNRVLDQLIEIKVFSKEAMKAGLVEDSQTREELEKAKKEISAKYFVKKYIDPQAEPSEEEVKKYYEEHKNDFIVPEGVFIQHILVKKQEDAEELLKKLKEGASFEELAKKKSIAPSWKNEGRLGWLLKGRMDPELDKVAFTLEKGKLSDVIQTKEGYQIIKVLEKSDKREVSLEEAKAKIRYNLFWKKKRELIDKYYKDAKVNRNPDEKGILFKIGDETFKEEILEPILAKAPDKEKEKVKERWVNYFIEIEVFSREAIKVGLEKDSEVADELKRKTDEILSYNFRKKFIEDKSRITDKEAEDYYQSHLEEFRIPLKVRAKTILVKTKKEAEIILKEIKKGTEFEILATEKSIHPSASNGGELGWFGKGEKDPEIEKATSSLKKGQISDIIKTKEGYQIIKVIEKGGGEVKPFKEVNEAIRITLQTQKFQAEKQRYYEKAGVKLLKENNQ